MSFRSLRIVLDTNVLVRGLISEGSPAARVIAMAETRVVIPLLNKPVVDEYRRVLMNRTLRDRFPSMTAHRVDVTLARLRFVAEYQNVPTKRFTGLRDQQDEKFLELAIDMRATHLLSLDDDLLSLASAHTEIARRFRRRTAICRILTPDAFLAHLAKATN